MTPAFTVTITADSAEQLQINMRDLLPTDVATDAIRDMAFQEMLIKVGERVEEEGYEMEVWKKGERETKPVPSTTSEKKKEQARAKLRGELIESLAEATHATAVVKEVLDEEGRYLGDAVKGVADDPEPVVEPEVKPKKAKAKTGNGKEETPDQIKARTIIKLQELYSAGKKAEVNKILAQYGEGSKTFSSIPADQFPAIAEAAEAL